MGKAHSLQESFFRPETLVILIVLLGAFFRVYRLNEFPPALYWDEAFDALDALRLTQTPVHPIFFDGNTGREPLTIYLQAVGILLWGAHAWVARLVPAIIGIATIPLLYRASVALFGGDAHAKRIGVLAAGMLAVSFWHVQLSRLSLRIVVFPLLSLLTVWLFWRAWQDRRVFLFAASGAALGLTLYAYLAARLLPLVFIGFGLAAGALALWRHSSAPRIDLRRAGLGLSVMLGVTVIVAVPLGIYFVQHPGALFLRTSSVAMVPGDLPGLTRLAQNVVATIRMFIDRGDMTAYYNLPGQPALDLVAALGFWIGLTIALARASTRPAYLLLLAWLGVNLLPTMFSAEAPHFLRASGALPPALILAADGLTHLWERLAPRWNPILVLMVVVAFGGALTANSYFNVWGPSQLVYAEFETSKRTIIERATALSATRDVILPFTLYSSPHAQFYLGTRFATALPFQALSAVRPAVWIGLGDVERAVVILQPDGKVLVPQPLDDVRLARLRELMKNSQPLENFAGQPIASELWMDDASPFLSAPQPARQLDVSFGGQFMMLGYEIAPSLVTPGSPVRVTHYWQALVDGESDYWIQSTLLDADSNVLARRVSQPVNGMSPTNFWRRSALVLDSFNLPVPASAHPGAYRLEVKVLSPAAPDAPLAVSRSEDRLLLNAFLIRENVNPAAIAHPLAFKFGEPALITLAGYDLADAPIRAGESVLIALDWKSERPVAVDYSVFLHLIDADGNVKAQQDGPPQNGNAPTSWWSPGDWISDLHVLSIPPDTPSGHYTLAIGIYDSATGARLPIFDVAGSRLPDDQWLLPVEIIGP